MKLTEFSHISYKINVNKKAIPIVEIPYSNYELWNELYFYAKSNFMQVKPTASSGMPNGEYKGYYRFMVTHHAQSHELVIVCASGCYRFIIQPSKLKGNTVSGRKSVIELYKIMDSLNIDFGKFACQSSQEGLNRKQEIESPLIQVCREEYVNRIWSHVYHLDFNSSYASRIVEAYPELKEPYEKLYQNRKNDNNYFKHVLTNSIGCFQSPYCPDYFDRRRAKPYQFANLSKIAINGTRAKVLEYKKKLVEAGMCPLVTNTDGIWYCSYVGPYHDKNEGTSLGQWKHDHKDCKFLMTSAGSYQYVEEGIVHTVLRGTSNLDKVKNREDWEFGDIQRLNGRAYYYFDEEKGIVEDYAE